jgi:hypothetical protein
MPASNPSISTFAGLAPPWSLSNLDTNFVNVAALQASVNTYTQYVVDTGAANAYVCSFGAGVTTTLSAGLGVCFKAANANTTASTLNVGATGVKNLLNLDSSALNANEILVGGIYYAIYDGTQYILLNPWQGGALSYTGTLTGCTTAPTGNITATKIGNQVTLDIPLFTATSNATAKTVTGMPTILRPATQKALLSVTSDNGGTFAVSLLRVETSGVLTYFTAPNGGTWTNSGVATLNAISISYTIA